MAVTKRAGSTKRRAVRPTRGVATIAKEAKRLEAVVASTRQTVQPLKLGHSFRIGPVKSVSRRFINAFIYGPYGHGKTTFVGSSDDVETMRDVLFVNADSGTMSLTNRRTMDFVDINHYDQLARIFEYLTLHCYYRDAKPRNNEKLLELERELKSDVVELEEQVEVDFAGNQAGTDPERTWFVEQRLRSGKPMDEPYIYRTVILDSVSELHKYLIYKYTGVDIGEHPLDEEVEKMDSWQPAQELFRLMIRSFRDLPMNCLMVSAEEIATRNESDRKKGRRAGTAYPKLAGAMAGDIAGFIDIVGYLQREIQEGGETHRYLYLGAGYEGWISKHRFENLPDLDFVEDPTLNSLIELARKDAEHGTSQSRPEANSSSVTPSRNAARTVTAKRSSSPVPASGIRRRSS